MNAAIKYHTITNHKPGGQYQYHLRSKVLFVLICTFINLSVNVNVHGYTDSNFVNRNEDQVTSEKSGSELPDEQLIENAKSVLSKGIEYFHSINIKGGYVYHYLIDMSRKWGETEYYDETIEVQPPGTPAVGMSFITAYEATKNPRFLEYAEETAMALISNQNKHGGWDHTITFGSDNFNRDVSFDDNQSQSAIRFIIKVDKHSDSKEISEGLERALNMMLKSQFENGAWSHYYPRQGNYHDYATFNDGGINNCINVMIDADKVYRKSEYRESIKKAGHYLFISQLPPPQPGWAQQYNEFLQPAWARTFEPPSVCPQVTLRNINSLIDIYLVTGDDLFLEPIPDAIRWIRESKLQNGKWGRFLELGTNKPLYYDRGRIKVNSVEELSIERRLTYGYEQDLSAEFDSTESRYREILNLGRSRFLKNRNKKPEGNELSEYLTNLEKKVLQIISEQDSLGRWISKNDRFKDKKPDIKWDGTFITGDRISSARFNHYVHVLCRYILLSEKGLRNN
jgi:hypothetical protein